MYNFEKVINRSKQGSAKWNLMKSQKYNVPEDISPLSIADTDLELAPEIKEGLKEYLDTMVLGYTYPTDSYYESIISWFNRRHNFSIKKDWIITSPGVVIALYDCVGAFTKENEGVIVMTPVYYPFYNAIKKQNRIQVDNPLRYEDGHYSIDFEDLETRAKDPNNTLLILCSPHNPVGRVWSLEELQKINEICLKHHVVVVSDEIHADLIMEGYTHTMFGNIDEAALLNCVIATAPSKSFNLAGLQTSNLIIANPELRNQFNQYIETTFGRMLNALGPKACELAYNKAENWLDDFILLIQHNKELVETYIEKHMPWAYVVPLEGTYLMWLDLNALGVDDESLNEYLINTCDIFIDPGTMFGSLGEGFIRINIACPSETLKEALNRLRALNNLD